MGLDLACRANGAEGTQEGGVCVATSAYDGPLESSSGCLACDAREDTTAERRRVIDLAPAALPEIATESGTLFDSDLQQLNVARVPQRVLALSWRDPWHPEAGGAEVMLHEHVTRWRSRGHAVTVFAADVPGRSRDEVVDHVRIVRRGGRFSVYAWGAIFYLLRFRRSTDVVLDVENGIPFFTPLYVRKPLVCLVHHVHRDQFLSEFGPVAGRIGRFIETRVMPLVYRRKTFVAVSESTREELARIGVDPSRVPVVHNGLDHTAYRPIAKKSRSPRFLYVGRLKRHKRVDVLIEMCGRLAREVPDLVLDIVGSGDDEERLRDLVADRGLARVVRFHGFTSHALKVGFYSQAWALLTATDREGWGLSIIEAAACGTPALCLDVPGVRDAVVHAKTGWLARSTEELYSAIARLIHDDLWRRSLSHAALERARQFTWQASASEAREVLIRTAQDHAGIRGRRSEDRAISAVLEFECDSIPESGSSQALRAVKRELRSDDVVAPRGTSILVEARVAAHADIPHLSQRVRVVLDRVCRGGEVQAGRVPVGG